MTERIRNLFKFTIAIVAIFIFSFPPVQAADQSRPDAMDMKALSARAAQLNDRVNKSPADQNAIYELGIIYHFMAVKDSKTYAEKAFDILEKLNRKLPNDALILCYLGNVYSLLARNSWNPISKSTKVKRGIEYMDRAVQMAPDHVGIRMTRGNNAKALPAFLDRRPVAYEDFNHVAELLKKDPKAPAQLKATVYRNLAALYQEDGNKGEAEKCRRLAEAVSKGEN